VRALGIDHGTVRTGVALSDPHGVTCRPLTVLEESDQALLIRRITDLAAHEGVELIVVGLPRPLRGGSNEQCRRASAFAAALAAATATPVVSWDERYTTKLARRGDKERGHRDAVAACHMLQGYLDAQALRRARSAEA